jgi:hypothetical protein
MAVSLREMKLFPISERLPYKLPSMPVALTRDWFQLEIILLHLLVASWQRVSLWSCAAGFNIQYISVCTRVLEYSVHLGHHFL